MTDRDPDSPAPGADDGPGAAGPAALPDGYRLEQDRKSVV